MDNLTTESYDDILYPSYTHNQSHPDRLAVISRLFGMNPAPVDHCRVLELGCGDGSNLVPMAFDLPQSEFVGIDRAALPIAKGQRTIHGLDLKNISLLQLDLLDLPADLGTFDYIIAHGLYSWVPAEVKERLMSIARSHLNAQGVAFISYNTYPGGHIRDMLREMMLFHVRTFSEPQQRINQSIALLKFLSESRLENDTYTKLLQEEVTQTLEYDQSLLYHDQLGAINTPYYFHQFANHAHQHGLQFLGEADYFEMQYHIYPPATTALLGKMAAESVILKEQYLDFLKCRRFRQTLLCHSEIEIKTEPQVRVLLTCYLASSARPQTEVVDLSANSVETFLGDRGAKVSTDYPLAKAALAHLAEIYPLSIHFSELVQIARRACGMESENNAEAQEQEETLADILLHAYATGMLELYPRAPSYVTTVSSHPATSAIVRQQIQAGTIVTNSRHMNIQVEDELGRQLLRLLDGTRDREMLLQELTALFTSGQATFGDADGRDDKSLPSSEEIAHDLDKSLKKLADLALLTS
jgi:methyltransferase-like protein/ubiquinone/menaquinone biosynthesis C-methylase UbiE